MKPVIRKPVVHAVVGLFLMVWAALAGAGEMPFSQKTFDDLRAAGKPVVVHVYAVWCGTCKVQSGLLAPMLEEPRFRHLTLLKADFDKERSLLKSLNVADRSTFVAFKGSTEVARSTGDMDKERIAALLSKAL
jgi:thioredoxin 1